MSRPVPVRQTGNKARAVRLSACGHCLGSAEESCNWLTRTVGCLAGCWCCGACGGFAAVAAAAAATAAVLPPLLLLLQLALRFGCCLSSSSSSSSSSRSSSQAAAGSQQQQAAGSRQPAAEQVTGNRSPVTGRGWRTPFLRTRTRNFQTRINPLFRVLCR